VSTEPADAAAARPATVCLPYSLAEVDDAGQVSCLFFVTLSNVTDPDACTDDPSRYPGLSAATSTVLSEVKVDQHAAYLQDAGAVDLSMFTTCVLDQVLPARFVDGTCHDNAGTDAGDQGWCYVTADGACPRSIQFTPMALPAGGILSTLQCIDPGSQFASDVDAGD